MVRWKFNPLADKRAVLLIVDGMADRPLIDHDYKTPLEYANTPNMDRLAKGGLVGQLDPISPGVRAGSDVANLALLGYDPAKYYTGRGALEAMGAGIELRPGDAAFRCKFATNNGEKAANIVLTRGAGTIPNLPSFKSMFDLRGTCISGKPMVQGIAMAAGMEVMDIKGATGGIKTDYEAKAKAVIEGSKDKNFVLVHVKAPDIAGHDGDFKGKVRTLEEVDTLVGHIIDEVDIGLNYVALTADHATPVGYGAHTGDPVPVIIGGPDVPASRVLQLSEASAGRGNLGRIRGLDLMPIVTDLVGRSRLYGS